MFSLLFRGLLKTGCVLQHNFGRTKHLSHDHAVPLKLALMLLLMQTKQNPP
ncbi:hypothetical protein CDAR_184271, partial [Caerostris darwini]